MRAESDGPDVSVIIACHDAGRWDSILAAVQSTLDQTLRPTNIIVTVDHDTNLAVRLRAELDARARVVENMSVRAGASANRNAGVAATRSEFVAFLDDDEIAEKDWLEELMQPFRDPLVVGTGGRYMAAWQGSRPKWLAAEFDWVVGAHTIMAPGQTQVRNVWAGNMAVRTDLFRAAHGFREGFGKVASHSQPEDTDLCIRMARQVEGGHWIYAPAARIVHSVPAERATFRFYMARCYWEGHGKIELKRLLGGSAVEVLSDEKHFLLNAVPTALRCQVRRGPSGWLPASTMVAGVMFAAAGALTAFLKKPLAMLGLRT